MNSKLVSRYRRHSRRGASVAPRRAVAHGALLAAVLAAFQAVQSLRAAQPRVDSVARQQIEVRLTARTVEIFMVNDGAVEANESFTVTLQGAQGGASVGSPGVATVTIVDNDRASAAPYEAP